MRRAHWGLIVCAIGSLMLARGAGGAGPDAPGSRPYWPGPSSGGSLAALIQRTISKVESDRYFIPTLFVDPRLGLNFGFRASHLNPIHHGGCITYRAAFGGTVRQLYAVTIRSRNEHRRGFTYRLQAKYELIPDHYYFGLGNLSRREDLTYYTQERYLFMAKFGFAPSQSLTFHGVVSAHRNQISRAAYIDKGEHSIEEIFHSEYLAPGLWVDPQNIWAEISATLDTRDSWARPHRGSKLEMWFGQARGTGPDLVDFVRYGFEVQHYFPLGKGRTFLARLSAEEARTSSELPIKFTELPALGGRSSLRGYLQNRFRDNGAVFWSLEYRYRLSRIAEGTLFADFGKVLPRLLDFDFSDVHRSWGAGVRFARDDMFYFRIQLAASDEDIVATVTLESAFDRADRRDRP